MANRMMWKMAMIGLLAMRCDAASSIFFGATDGTNGRELWKTDGTAAGTVMVKDLNPAGDSYPVSVEHRPLPSCICAASPPHTLRE